MVIYDNQLTYSIIKNQDFIIIKLNENLENISVSLLKQNTCEENTFDILKDPELLIDTIVYRLPIIDGIYQIKINIQGVITNYNFLYYDNLLKSIINDVETVLCNSLNSAPLLAVNKNEIASNPFELKLSNGFKSILN